MTGGNHKERAVELLCELGLTEYEAQCFVALSRLGEGTAREVSDISSVPRTRVYEIADKLATRGLVETQQTNPKRFRTISLDAAVAVLQEQFIERTEELRDSLAKLEPIDDEQEANSELWTLADEAAIEQRVLKLVADAEDEIMYYVSRPEICSEQVVTALQEAHDRGVNVIIGTTTEETFELLDDLVPEQLLLKLDQEWFTDQSITEEESAIVRMLVVDRHAILVSTGNETTEEDHAIFGQGLNNGLVVVVRRLMASSIADVTTVN